MGREDSAILKKEAAADGKRGRGAAGFAVGVKAFQAESIPPACISLALTCPSQPFFFILKVPFRAIIANFCPQHFALTIIIPIFAIKRRHENGSTLK